MGYSWCKDVQNEGVSARVVVAKAELRKRCACKSKNEAAKRIDNEVEREMVRMLMAATKTVRRVCFRDKPATVGQIR